MFLNDPLQKLFAKVHIAGKEPENGILTFFAGLIFKNILKTTNIISKKMANDLAFIIDHTRSLSKEDLVANEVLLDSIMFRLIQISENSD